MKRIALATLAALLFSSAPFPQDKSAAADEIQIKQLERAWNQAEAKQEVREVSSLLADSLVYTDYDGTFMNKSEYMKWVVAPQQKADHLYDEGISVQVYGAAAVATGIYRRHLDQTRRRLALCGQPKHTYPTQIICHASISKTAER
jgi:hypothetical protein